MKCFIGIDLGSTTTKAVVLDVRGRVIGRGITNSRSNYDVACDVARNEALMDARFYLFGQSLSVERAAGDQRERFLDLLRRNFRLEQYLAQLARLEDTCKLHADQMSHAAGADLISKTTARIFESMRLEASGFFARGVRARSDFFRDLAGSRYSALSRHFAKSANLEFETLVGIFDKSIIAVENRDDATAFEEMLRSAFGRSLSEYDAEDIDDGLRRALENSIDAQLSAAVTVGTGYGRARLPFPKERIRSEILCHGLGAHAMFPATRTVLDIGGQDTKAIQVDEHGIVTSFQMNDRCAAGCGRYLGYIAEEMNLGLHELGPLAMESRKAVRINSTCTVFAGAELRDRIAGGQRREDILDGLHRAIMLRAMSLLARSGGVHDEFTFTGGVAKNPAAVRALRALVRESYGERSLNISAESIYTGALGAAIFALREETPKAEVALATGGSSWS